MMIKLEDFPSYAKGMRRSILAAGKKKLGVPDEKMLAVLEAIKCTERLEALSERVTEVGSWQELLAGEKPG
jgi:hypothetical protein